MTIIIGLVCQEEDGNTVILASDCLVKEKDYFGKTNWYLSEKIKHGFYRKKHRYSENNHSGLFLGFTGRVPCSILSQNSWLFNSARELYMFGDLFLSDELDASYDNLMKCANRNRDDADSYLRYMHLRSIKGLLDNHSKYSMFLCTFSDRNMPVLAYSMDGKVIREEFFICGGSGEHIVTPILEQGYHEGMGFPDAITLVKTAMSAALEDAEKYKGYCIYAIRQDYRKITQAAKTDARTIDNLVWREVF